MQTVKPLLSLKVTLHNAAASLPTPSNAGTDGQSVLPWRQWGGGGPDKAHLRIKSTGPTNIGIVGLWMVDDENVITFLTLLNNGQPIDMLTASIAFAQQINGICAAKRLIVGAVAGIAGSGTPSPGANITVDVWPLAVREDL
jgi:hypothetical protein